MHFKAVQENDGTYSIRASRHGLNWEVVMLGVRGCNVGKTIAKLQRDWASEI